MSNRHRHGSRSRWLLEQVRWEISRNTEKPTTTETLRDIWDRRPFLWSSIVHAIFLLSAWMVGTVDVFPHISFLDVADPQSALETSWQVLAAFASIAFAGLAILMQLTSEPVVTSRGVREVLFRESQFRPILAFSIVGSIQLGVAALLLDQPESALVEFSVVVATVLWIAWSYSRVANVFARPGEALRLGEKAILQDLKKSLRSAHTRAVAESRLHELVPREWRWSSANVREGVVLLSAERSGVLADLDLSLLRDIKRRIAGSDTTSFTASGLVDAPDMSSDEPAPELRIMVSVGSTVELGEDIFILKNAPSYSGNLEKLRRRLRVAIRWEGSA